MALRGTDNWEICRLQGGFKFKAFQLVLCAFLMALQQHDGKRRDHKSKLQPSAQILEHFPLSFNDIRCHMAPCHLAIFELSGQFVDCFVGGHWVLEMKWSLVLRRAATCLFSWNPNLPLENDSSMGKARLDDSRECSHTVKHKSVLAAVKPWLYLQWRHVLGCLMNMWMTHFSPSFFKW